MLIVIIKVSSKDFIKSSSCLLKLFLLLILTGFSSYASAVNKVTNIRSNSTKEKLQIVVDVTQSPDFKVFSLSEPIRVVIDVNANLAENYKNLLNFKNRGVLRVRTGAKSETETRIVVDLSKDFRWKVFAMKPENNKKGNRLVIEVYDYSNSVVKEISKTQVATIKADKNQNIELESAKIQGLKSKEDLVAIELESTKSENKHVVNVPTTDNNTVSTVATVSDLTAKTTDPAVNNNIPNISASKNDKPPKIIVASKSKPATSIFNEVESEKTTSRSTYSRDIIVMIDPGHGGKDSGAVGPKKTKEKDVVLKIAQKLKKHIDSTPGMRAILTRNSDVYIPLRGRINLARKNNADLFISIHADAFITPDASGSSVFILSNKGASSEAAKWLAQSENSSDIKYGIDIGDYDPDVSKVLLDIQQSATLETSYLLANTTLKQLKGLGKTHRGSVERAGFVVLKSPEIPSMLVETAFISNPDEEKKLKTDSYQEKIAKSVASGVKKYYETHLPHHLLVIEPN